MCGIIGFTGKRNDRIVKNLLDSIEHRGRDDRALFYADGINLGMTRLAVIDLHKGIYPIRYKQYVLIYNGEIYNYPALRAALEKKGYRFRTSCDAEVILPLYDLYGSKAFTLLDGMFAVCIYDTYKKQLILSRDKAGEKPLYFYSDKSSFVFASELKAIITYFPRSLHIKKESCAEYLSSGFVRGSDTILEGVRKLLPGHVLIVDQRKRLVVNTAYWQTPNFIGHSDCSPETLDVTLRRSVSSRMIADVPVGCFLSGGVDSSLMTYYASLVNPDMHTFSLRFPGSLHYDESRFARFAARHIGTTHHEVLCDSRDVKKIVRNIGTLIDEPISDPAFIPTLVLAKEAKRYVSVVLSGEGADELFAGYPRYIRQRIVETVRRHVIPKAMLMEIRRVLLPHRFKNINRSLPDRYHTQDIWSKKELERILPGITNNRHPDDRPIGDPLAWMQKNDFTGYLPDQLLMKVDKATMAHTLEARAPYLAADSIRLAATLSNDLRIRFFQPKYLLKKIAQRYFPLWFVWRPKHGFSVPLGDWFNTFLRPQILMLPREAGELFGKSAGECVGQIVSDHVSGKTSSPDKLWSMLVLIRWMEANNISL